MQGCRANFKNTNEKLLEGKSQGGDDRGKKRWTEEKERLRVQVRECGFMIVWQRAECNDVSACNRVAEVMAGACGELGG